jgi:Resolvase, N terminal domain
MTQNKLPGQKHPLITPKHLRRRAVIYCRRKAVNQNPSSMASQRSLAKIARFYGWTDTLILVIEDFGKTGLFTVGRRGFQRLEEMIDADEVGAVFVSTLDRLSRDALELEFFRFRVSIHHTLLYTDAGFVDLSGESDRILSEFIRLSDQWFDDQDAKATAMSSQRSAHPQKLLRLVGGKDSGQGNKQ